MKAVKNLFILIGIFLIYFTSSIISFADSIRWSDLKSTYNYDYSGNRTTIRVYVNEDIAPSNSYYANFEINGSRYTKDFYYDSYTDQLYFEHTIYSNSYYDNSMYIEVINRTTGSREFQNRIYPTQNFNNYNWNNVKVDTDYNSSTNYLRVKVYLDNIENYPSGNYSSLVNFNNKTYSSTFSYSYSEKRFYATHDIYVDKYNSSKTYYFTVKVQDNNFSRTLFETSKSIYIDSYYYDNNLNWGNLNVSYYYNYNGNSSTYCNNNTYYNDYYYDDGYNPNSGISYYEYYYGNSSNYRNNTSYNNNNCYNNYNYNNNRGTLEVRFELNNVNYNPSANYAIKLKYNGKDYSKTMSYDSVNRRLYVNFSVNLNDTYNNNYNNYFSYSVVNNSTYKTVYSNSSYNLDYNYNSNFNTNYSYNNGYRCNYDYYNNYYCYNVSNTFGGYVDDKIDWSNISISNSSTSNNDLYVNFIVNGINSKPKNSYYIKMNIAGKDFTQALSYNQSLKQLTATFTLNMGANKMKDYYYISYSVVNSIEDYVESANPIFKLKISASNSSNNSTTNSLVTQTVNQVVKKAESTYSSKIERIKYLERTITNFNNYGKNNPEYKDFSSQIISELKKKIEYYKNGNSSTNNGSIFPMFEDLY